MNHKDKVRHLIENYSFTEYTASCKLEQHGGNMLDVLKEHYQVETKEQPSTINEGTYKAIRKMLEKKEEQ